MDRLYLRGVLSLLAILGATQAIAHCNARQAPAAPAAVERRAPVRSSTSSYASYSHEPARAVVEAPHAALDGPDTCRKLVYKGRGKARYISKTKPAWLSSAAGRAAHQAEIRELVFAVADKLGADDLAAELIWRKAIYEASGDESNLHMLNPDVRANKTAAGKGKRRAAPRWQQAEVAVFEDVGEGRLVEAGQVDAWTFGRGLFGQVTGLHMHRWSPDAPPWALCDPVVATVTMIWAMRAGLDECHGETLRDAYRRFSSGKCATRSDELEGRFDRLARGRVRGLKLAPFNPDARAELGDHWDEATTNREVLLAVLRARVDGLH